MLGVTPVGGSAILYIYVCAFTARRLYMPVLRREYCDECKNGDIL